MQNLWKRIFLAATIFVLDWHYKWKSSKSNRINSRGPNKIGKYSCLEVLVALQLPADAIVLVDDDRSSQSFIHDKISFFYVFSFKVYHVFINNETNFYFR